jgi:hypothetical protein
LCHAPTSSVIKLYCQRALLRLVCFRYYMTLPSAAAIAEQSLAIGHLRPFLPTCLIAAEMKFCGECGVCLQPGPSPRQLASENQVEHGASPFCRHRVGVSASIPWVAGLGAAKG